MFGSGLLKGLGVTIKHFVETYVDDLKAIPSRYAYGHDLIRQTPDEEGLFTIQYPEEKRQLPERFRYIPMLIYDTPKQEDRCTACGICAKVCPPQCIWIVRDQDESGKPIPRPSEFYIDASICMSCGFCAEFCPFDAIKMNHDYELAVYQRYPTLVYNMAELTVPLEYYAALYPTQFAEEEQRRAEEEAKKAARASRRGRGKAEAEAEAPAKPAPPKKAAPEPTVQPDVPTPPPAVVAAAAAAAVAGYGKPALAKAKRTSGLSYEELEQLRAEAYERYKARKGPDAKVLHVAAATTAAATAPSAPTELAATVEEAPVAPEPAATVQEAPVAPKPEALVPPEPDQAAEPQASAAPPGAYGKPQLAAAQRTSDIGYDELEQLRAEAYERYKARKGSDAKDLGH